MSDNLKEYKKEIKANILENNSKTDEIQITFGESINLSKNLIEDLKG